VKRFGVLTIQNGILVVQGDVATSQMNYGEPKEDLNVPNKLVGALARGMKMD